MLFALNSEPAGSQRENGIVFSQDTLSALNTEHELRLTEMEEAKKQVEIVESQMRNVREEFEQSMALLMLRDGELKESEERRRQPPAS